MAYPGARIALRVDRDVTAADGQVLLSDSRYFLASLDPSLVKATELLGTARAHWQIENCVFFIKDRWWDEDRHWTIRPGVSEWLAQLTTAAAFLLPVALVVERPYALAAPSWSAAGALLLLAVLSTALAFVLYYRLMESTGATTLSMVTYMIPVVAAILGVVVLHEELGWHVYLACALIILGVMTVNGVFRSFHWRQWAEAASS